MASSEHRWQSRLLCGAEQNSNRHWLRGNPLHKISSFYYLLLDALEGFWRFGPVLFWQRVRLAAAQRAWANLPIATAQSNSETGSICPTEKSQVEFDLVIPVFGAANEVSQLLIALTLHRPEGLRASIIVDDGSHQPSLTDMLTEFVGRTPGAELVENSVNRGFAESVTVGIAKSKSEFVVVLNSDTLPPAGALDRLVSHLQADEKMATICPLSNNAAFASIGPPSVSAQMEAIDILELDKQLSENCGRSYEVPFSSGFCWGVRRSVFVALDGFVPELADGYGEEADFCLRAWARGYRCCVAADAAVYHKGSSSFGKRQAERLSRLHSFDLLKKHPIYLELVLDDNMLEQARSVREMT